MHISLLLKSFTGGGAERVMLSLAAAFVRSGHRVDLLVGRAQGPLAEHIPSGVRVRLLARFSTPRVLGCMARLPAVTLARLGRNVMQPPQIMRTLPDLEAYLRENRPDVLMATLSKVNILAAWAVHLAGGQTRLVLREANQFTHNLNPSNRFDRSLPALARQWYPRADCIIAVSPGVRENLILDLGLQPGRVVSILNPVDRSRISAAAARWTADRAGLAPNDEFVLAVGKLKPQKGFNLLLQAFAQAFPDGPLKLVIAGAGPQQSELRRLAQCLKIDHRVLLPGHLHEPYDLMSRAKLFVLSSLWEGCPNVLLEALACGCPIVSTDCPSGPRDLLAGGRYGRLVPVSQVGALADAMGAALKGSCPVYDPNQATAAYAVDCVAGRYLQSMATQTLVRTTA